MTRSVSLSLATALAIAGSGMSFTLPNASTARSRNFSPLQSTVSSSMQQEVPSSPWFTDDENTNQNKEKLKTQILQLGAALDRGQSFNPTSGEYYSSSMETARSKIQSLIALSDPETNVPKSLDDIAGEWELVFTTVKHGIFRSSPFFLAVQEAFEYAEEKEAFGEDKATLFFKLHELQTCSWGVSKIGRVAQRIDPKSAYLYSEFDTSIFSLTVIPILGWFKLLPTFGGCVVTASKAKLADGGVLEMEVDYTTSRPVPGLQGLGEWIWKVKVPVGAVWKLLPWNKGRSADCSVTVKYFDDDFRIVEDKSGDLFVYSRPVVKDPSSAELDILSKVCCRAPSHLPPHETMSNIPGSAHPAFGFGAVTIAGGLAGFVRKGSKASLGAGVVCGSLLIGSGLMISGESQYGGHSLAAGTSALMVLGMGQRFLKTGKFMPAGIVATLAAASSAYHVKKALEWSG